jgi:hypothetical protein
MSLNTTKPLFMANQPRSPGVVLPTVISNIKPPPNPDLQINKKPSTLIPIMAKSYNRNPNSPPLITRPSIDPAAQLINTQPFPTTYHSIDDEEDDEDEYDEDEDEDEDFPPTKPIFQPIPSKSLMQPKPIIPAIQRPIMITTPSPKPVPSTVLVAPRIAPEESAKLPMPSLQPKSSQIKVSPIQTIPVVTPPPISIKPTPVQIPSVPPGSVLKPKIPTIQPGSVIKPKIPVQPTPVISSVPVQIPISQPAPIQVPISQPSSVIKPKISVQPTPVISSVSVQIPTSQPGSVIKPKIPAPVVRPQPLNIQPAPMVRPQIPIINPQSISIQPPPVVKSVQPPPVIKSFQPVPAVKIQIPAVQAKPVQPVQPVPVEQGSSGQSSIVMRPKIKISSGSVIKSQPSASLKLPSLQIQGSESKLVQRSSIIPVIHPMDVRSGSGSNLAVTSPRTGSINLVNDSGTIPLTPPDLVPNPLLVPVNQTDSEQCCVCWDQMVPGAKLTECKHAICGTCFPQLRSKECPACTRVLQGGYLTPAIQQQWVDLENLNARIEKFLDDNENISLREFIDEPNMNSLSRNTRDAYRTLLQDYPQLLSNPHKPPYDRAIEGYRAFSRFYHNQLDEHPELDANGASELFKQNMMNLVSRRK